MLGRVIELAFAISLIVAPVGMLRSGALIAAVFSMVSISLAINPAIRESYAPAKVAAEPGFEPSA